MKLKPVVILILIVVVPVVLLTWVGMRLARHERAILEQQMLSVLSDRLRDIDRAVAAHFAALGRELHQLTDIDSFDADELRRRIRDDARVIQLFVIRPDGSLLHPNPLGSLNRSEHEFLTQASQIISDRELQRAAQVQSDDPAAANLLPRAAQSKSGRGAQSPAGSAAGWFVWYWGRGLNLIYWQRNATGHTIGAALDRARWIADVIAVLPDTPLGEPKIKFESTTSRIRLVDSASQPVYQWGRFDPPDNAAPTCEIPLSSPLSAWRLQQFVPDDFVVSRGTSAFYLNLGPGIAVATIGLVTLAVYFYREYARDMREAGQRVSFVNQVSHELRTPLTNIRMYADLLDSDLDNLTDDVVKQPRQRLSVIQTECQRLSRLIGNVLAFARQQRQTLRLRATPCCVDQIVSDVVDHFRPSLEQVGIQTEIATNASATVMADADAIEQILGNLINNVERYANGGHWLGITTCQKRGRTRITVADRGPGVESKSREAVFQPFWRASHSVDRVAGTGIGLSIARELARLHGGDVTLLASEQGAIFQVELATPKVNGQLST